jgi:antitoxin ParD1/3/4
MNIALSPEQQKFLEAEVAAGHFPSIEAAVGFALDHLIPGNLSDLSWAKPYVDEARAALARGEHISIDDYRRRLAERIQLLRDQ